MVHVQSGRLYTGRLRGGLRLQPGRGFPGQVRALLLALLRLLYYHTGKRKKTHTRAYASRNTHTHMSRAHGIGAGSIADARFYRFHRFFSFSVYVNSRVR